MVRVVAVALLALVLTAPARAVTHVGPEDHFHPTGADLAAALQLAADYWGMPPCGQPTVSWGGEPGTDPAVAYHDQCRFTIPAADATSSYTPAAFCMAVVHEWGHLRLGPAFQAVNPGDPWHSPDPRSPMYANGGALIPIPGCAVFAAQRTARSATRGHHHRRATVRR